jgi:hypothetical protein
LNHLVYFLFTLEGIISNAKSIQDYTTSIIEKYYYISKAQQQYSEIFASSGVLKAITNNVVHEASGDDISTIEMFTQQLLDTYNRFNSTSTTTSTIHDLFKNTMVIVEVLLHNRKKLYNLYTLTSEQGCTIDKNKQILEEMNSQLLRREDEVRNLTSKKEEIENLYQIYHNEVRYITSIFYSLTLFFSFMLILGFSFETTVTTISIRIYIITRR